MKNTFLVALTATAALLSRDTYACMSDTACGEDECCYMNLCAPSSSVECSSARMDIFKALSEANMMNLQDVKDVVSGIRNQFNVSECDQLQDGCIDYIGIMAQQVSERGAGYSLSLAGRAPEGTLEGEVEAKTSSYGQPTMLAIAAACGIAGIMLCANCGPGKARDKDDQFTR